MRRAYTLVLIGIAALLGLTGCAATSPNVAPIDKDAYQLSVTGTRYETQADTNLKALNAANDFCAKQGMHLMFRQSTESGDHMWSEKREELTFVCMNSNDPGYMQASVNRNPPVVAQE